MVPDSMTSDKRDGQHGTEKKIVNDANLSISPHEQCHYQLINVVQGSRASFISESQTQRLQSQKGRLEVWDTNGW